jgi:hypothetical protein
MLGRALHPRALFLRHALGAGLDPLLQGVVGFQFLVDDGNHHRRPSIP